MAAIHSGLRPEYAAAPATPQVLSFWIAAGGGNEGAFCKHATSAKLKLGKPSPPIMAGIFFTGHRRVREKILPKNLDTAVCGKKSS
jgi:hypothetical protein